MYVIFNKKRLITRTLMVKILLDDRTSEIGPLSVKDMLITLLSAILSQKHRIPFELRS